MNDEKIEEKINTILSKWGRRADKVESLMLLIKSCQKAETKKILNTLLPSMKEKIKR